MEILLCLLSDQHVPNPLAVHHFKSDGNEYDVAFVKDYTLYGLECKSGRQFDDPKSNVLYKAEAAMWQFRGSGGSLPLPPIEFWIGQARSRSTSRIGPNSSTAASSRSR